MRVGGRLLRLARLAASRGAAAVAMLAVYYSVAATRSTTDAAPIFFVLTATTLALPVVLLGYHTLSVKILASQPPGFLAAYIRSLAVRCATLIMPFTAALLLLFAAVLLIAGWDPAHLITASATMLVLPLAVLIGYVFQGLKAYSLSIFIINTCFYVTLTVVIWAFWSLGIAPTAFVVGIQFMSSSLLTLIVAAVFLLVALHKSRRVAHEPPSVPEFSFTTEHGRQAVRFWFVLVLVNITGVFPQLSYYAFGPKHDYALFSVAERLANVVNFFSIISNFFLAPMFAESHAAGRRDEVRQRFVEVTRLMIIVSMPFALVMALVPTWVLGFFGPEYVAGWPYLVIMVIGQYFNVATGSVKTMLNMTDQEGALIVTLLVSFAASVVVLVIAAPLSGGVGFALAYTVNLACQNAVAAIFVRRRLGISVWSVFSRVRSPSTGE